MMTSKGLEILGPKRDVPLYLVDRLIKSLTP